MKLQRTICLYLIAIMACSLSLSLVSKAYNCQTSEIIFRSIFTGCMVGSITSLLVYFQNKNDVLNQINENLIETHQNLKGKEFLFEQLINEINAQQNLSPDYIEWVITRIEIFATGFNFKMFFTYKYDPFFFESKKNCNITRIINQLRITISSIAARARCATILFSSIRSDIKLGKHPDDKMIKKALDHLLELKNSIPEYSKFAENGNSYIEDNFKGVIPHTKIYKGIKAFMESEI